MSEVRLSSQEAVGIICDRLSELALQDPAFAKVDIDVVRDVLSVVTKNLFAPCSSKDSFNTIVSERLSNVEKHENGVQVMTIVDAFKNWFVFAISDLSQETLNHYKNLEKSDRRNYWLSVVAIVIAIISLTGNFVYYFWIA